MARKEISSRRDSEGRRLLVALDLTSSQIAGEIGVSAASVHGWRQGRTVPQKSKRKKLHTYYGIPVASWTHVAPGPAPEPKSREPKPLPTGAPRVDRRDLEALTTIEGVIEHVYAIESMLDDPELKTADRLRLMTAKTAAFKLKAQLEHAAEVTEDRVVRQHPKWRAIREGLLAVLAEHPEARGAVIELLEGLEV